MSNSVDCIHAGTTAHPSRVQCVLGLYGRLPHVGVCGVCGHRKPAAGVASRGLGDTVAKVIHSVTFGVVTPCGGCRKRQEALNATFPYHTAGQEGGQK